MTTETEKTQPTIGIDCRCGEKISLDRIPFEAFDRRFVAQCDHCGARFEIIKGEHSQIGLVMPRGRR